MPSLAFTTTSASTVVSSADLNVPTTNTSDVGGTTNAGGTLTFTSSYMTSSELVTNKIDPASSWTVDELKILGVILWLVLIVTLIGNLACFYAVIKNLKALLQHPFFQSNMFCVYLSFVDVFLVVLVGIPAALSYTTGDRSYGDSLYNRAVANPILDFATWLQLLLVVAICVDRAGHICRPLRYTYNITACKTATILVTCTAIPFLTLELPYIIASVSTVDYWASMDIGDIKPEEVAYVCDMAREFGEDGVELISDRNIFLTCVLQLNDNHWGGTSGYKDWMNVANPLLMVLAVTALAATSGIIVYKLNKSARMQKDNAKRQDEVAKSIKLTCTVSFFQALLILISTLPLRWYQIDDRIRGTSETGYKVYTSHYKVIARTLVFLGPIFNPWLYPIRMASIRSFLITKKKKVASSVNTNITRLKSSFNLSQSDRQNCAVNTKLLSEQSTALDKNQSTAL